MRTCPYCQFLVADGATSCSVCHRDLTAPTPTPQVAPGSTVPNVSPQAPYGAVPPPFTAHPSVPPGRTSVRWGVILGVGAALAFMGLLGLVALITLLGSTVETPALRSGDVEVHADELEWEHFEDPAGRFAVDLPGVGVANERTLPGAFGAEVHLEMVTVADPSFQATVGRYAEQVPAGTTFDQLPFSTGAAERMVAAGGFEDAQIVEQHLVDGTGGAAMEFEMTGRVDGEPAVLLSRLVVAGPDLYELNVAGPEEHRSELLEIHDRLTSTFVVPTTA